MTYTDGDYLITDPMLGAFFLLMTMMFVGFVIVVPVAIMEWRENRKSVSDPNDKVSS